MTAPSPGGSTRRCCGFIDTGARRIEVANLRWAPTEPEANDVDLDLDQLRLLGKGRRARLVAVGRQTVRALDRYLRLRDRHGAAHLLWLWLGPRGRFIDSGIAQMVRGRARAAGLGEHVYLHQLRHLLVNC